MKFNRFFLIISALCLLAVGWQSFITSSEFWLIYASKNLIYFNSDWVSLFMKPLFNTLLFTFHLVPLSDASHIQLVKLFFAINGALQFVILYKILDRVIADKDWIALPLTWLLLLTPYYLTHYFSVRSDQLALTVFLYFIFVNITTYKFSSAWNILIIILFPMIGFKHIYFSALALVLIQYRKTFSFFLVSTKNEKFYLFLLLAGVVIWVANLAIKSFGYFLSSFQSFKSSSFEIIQLAQIEFLFLLLSSLCFLSADFREFLRRNHLKKWSWMQLLVIIIVLIHPQKFNFFIASLTPIFYLSGAFFLIFVMEKRARLFKFFFPAVIAIQVGLLFYAANFFPLFTTNSSQLVTIKKIAHVLQGSHFSYLDGMGALPRQINTGCFVSPDDFQSNEACVTQIKRSIPDSVIMTNRLMSLNFEPSLLLEAGYTEIGPNFFIKNSLVENIKSRQSPADLNWPPPVIVFAPSFIN